MSEFDECIRLLLVATKPVSIQSIVAHVPHDRQGVVGRLVLQSSLVASTTSGKIQHVWAEHARKLTAEAKDEIRVFPWATAAGTPAPIAFVTHVMDNVDVLGLHTRWYGVVREQTTLNVYDCDGLVACVKHAAEVGVNRDDIMAEYELAYADFHNLIKTKKFFATNDRAWHV
jgi:hypothetical protein